MIKNTKLDKKEGMDSEILKAGFGINGVDITQVENEDGVLKIHIETKRSLLKCGTCGSRQVIKRGNTIRHFKDVPIGLMPVVLVATVNRLECKSCGALGQEKLKYAEKKKIYE